MEQVLTSLFTLMVIIWTIPFLLFCLWVWILVACVKDKNMEGTEKAVWIAIVLFGSLLGGIVYLFAKSEIDADTIKVVVMSGVVIFLIIATIGGFVNYIRENERVNKIIRKPVTQQQSQYSNNQYLNNLRTDMPTNIHIYVPNKQRTNIKKANQRIIKWIDANSVVHYEN